MHLIKLFMTHINLPNIFTTKFHPQRILQIKRTEGEKMYNFTLSLISALDGGWLSAPCPSCFTQAKTRYPLYRRLGGPHTYTHVQLLFITSTNRRAKLNNSTQILIPPHVSATGFHPQRNFADQTNTSPTC